MYHDEIDVDDLQINALHRVILTKVDDKGDQQLVNYKGLEGEEHTEVLRIQPFGFSSVPPKDSEALVASLGTRDMPVVLGAEHPDHRPKNLKDGAFRNYDKSGAYVESDGEGNMTMKNAKGTFKMDKDGNITAEGKSLTFKGPITIEGDIDHKGNLTSTGNHKAAAHV